MKILVADDDALIRRLLLALLAKLGHEVQAVDDGNAAWQALDTLTPPDLAILDWVMPGLNGVEVCKKIRALNTKTRPYILLLSAKSDKQEIIAGLDAGADDYLVKPFDPMALMARLRVAQRIITYQQELQHSIGTMEALLQRHNLLGEMYGKQNRAADPGTAPKGASAKTAPARVAASPLVSPEAVNEMLARSLAEVGLGSAQVTTVPAARQSAESSFTAWAPLVLAGEGLWLDFLLEADDASAVAMFETLLGRIPVSERELLDFLAETFNLVATSIKTSLLEKGCPALAPVISRSIRSSALTVRAAAAAETTHHHIALPDINCHVTLARLNAPVVTKTLGQLHELDVLAENLPSPSATEVFLLNQGVVLNERYIDKLAALAKAANKDLRVPVIKPSRHAEFFCLGRIAPS